MSELPPPQVAGAAARKRCKPRAYLGGPTRVAKTTVIATPPLLRRDCTAGRGWVGYGAVTSGGY